MEKARRFHAVAGLAPSDGDLAAPCFPVCNIASNVRHGVAYRPLTIFAISRRYFFPHPCALVYPQSLVHTTAKGYCFVGFCQLLFAHFPPVELQTWSHACLTCDLLSLPLVVLCARFTSYTYASPRGPP